MRNKKLAIIFIILSVICLILIFTGIFFRVKEIEIYCYNVDDHDFEQRILDVTDIKGDSIFTLDESNLIDMIHQSVLDAKIINIERKFPNRVLINVVKKIRFAYIALPDKYLLLDNDLKVLEETVTEPYDLIEISFLETPNSLSSVTIGQNLLELDEYESMQILQEVCTSLERLDYRNFDVLRLIKSIELDFSEKLFTLKTSAGVKIEISGSSNILKKVVASVELFTSLNDEQRSMGIIRAFDFAEDESVRASYSQFES